MFFFKDIRNSKKETYLKSVLEADNSDILHDLILQTRSLANGVYRKYKWLCYVGWLVGVEFLLLLIWVIGYLIVNNN